MVPFTLGLSLSPHPLVAARSACPPGWALLAQRSISRLRAGYFRVGHVGGQRSGARVQSCALCGGLILDGAIHAVLFCPALADHREALWSALCSPPPLDVPSAALGQLLLLHPGEEGFVQFAVLVGALEEALESCLAGPWCWRAWEGCRVSVQLL